jgi:hypothetical protein
MCRYQWEEHINKLKHMHPKYRQDVDSEILSYVNNSTKRTVDQYLLKGIGNLIGAGIVVIPTTASAFATTELMSMDYGMLIGTFTGLATVFGLPITIYLIYRAYTNYCLYKNICDNVKILRQVGQGNQVTN